MARNRDKTSMGGPQEAFQVTRWTEIRGLSSQSEAIREQILEGLVRQYWKPVYCYLRRKGRDNETAKDLTQGFFQEVVLRTNLVQQADQTKGRFRTYLLTALDRYASNVHRSEVAQKRSPVGGLVHIDDEDLANLAVAQPAMAPEQMFDYAWVTELLDTVLQKVKDDCIANGREVYWEVFEARVLSPITNDSEPMSLPDICSRFGVEGEQKVSNMIVTVKRTFKAVLERQLRQSVRSDAEMRDEFNELIGIFSTHSAR